MHGFGSHTYSFKNANNDSIENGNLPMWKLHIQVMTEQEANSYAINPFDLTKSWPYGDYPLLPVGEFVLNKNPENYFAEVEQVAFNPANIVPGIDFLLIKCCNEDYFLMAIKLPGNIVKMKIIIHSLDFFPFVDRKKAIII